MGSDLNVIYKANMPESWSIQTFFDKFSIYSYVTIEEFCETAKDFMWNSLNATWEQMEFLMCSCTLRLPFNLTTKWIGLSNLNNFLTQKLSQSYSSFARSGLLKASWKYYYFYFRTTLSITVIQALICWNECFLIIPSI